MTQPLIVTQPFDHIQHAAYSKLKQTLTFKKYDTIMLNGSPHYLDPVGWYIPLASSTNTFHMASDKLEEYYLSGYVTTYDDLVLQKNYIEYKINRSLDLHAKEDFTHYTEQLKDVDQLLTHYKENRNPVAQ
ncbi:hypothetical protein GCM10010954_34160 [Halobacillus andaensis]|uniref:Uncharacterized protein n=1 Tax=Halobacillus andaensis TaxID=1176239 RepID=A0A917BA20_HALAA|nr:hypothetical protein [Halobacillus andaensis]MBP2005522.1 hypothetical protein [Halobacillus andaensis]GGF32158.1 hypothetical protein GCM10010954_34160 [Halobacillus andaensis]